MNTTKVEPSEAVAGPVERPVRQHTPGPWQFELAPSGGFDIEKDPNDLGRYMVIATRSSHQARAAEMHANARLIASAPDLLAALEAVLAWGTDENYERAHAACEAARAAVAKAIGSAA